jgi:glutaredoxin
MPKARVTLFTRPGCHLCEEARQQILAAGCTEDYTLEEVNIDSHPALKSLYGTDIPVVAINGLEAFRHRLTSEDFRRKLQSLTAAP